MEETKLNKVKMVVIGGSSGSLQVVMDVLAKLPENYPLPILLIIHRTSSNDSMLCELLNIKSKMTVREVEEKDKIIGSSVYLAPADYHVLFERDETFTLDYSEKVNYSRPSLDVSFISASLVYGKELVGILLSGANQDGAEGLKVIKEQGGQTIIQDPNEAMVSYMPLQASYKSKIDLVLNTNEITNHLISIMPVSR